MSTKTELKTKTELQQEDKIKAAAITHAVEVKSAFELYAYRVISHEIFIKQITDLTQFFIKNLQENGK